MSWGIALALALGAVCIVLALVVRAGASRTFYPMYRTNAPPWVRNRVFSLLPGGIALIAGAGAVAFARADLYAAGAALTAVTVVAGIVTMIWSFKPPEFMKPRWLRDLESGKAPEPPELAAVFGAPGPGGARRVYLPPPVYWGLWAATVLIFVLWLVLHWSWGWLVGLGMAISQLAASTPRKNRRA